MLIFGYRLKPWKCIEAGCLTTLRCHCLALLLGLRLLLGYRNYTQKSIMSAHILIENTLVEHKMAKNSRMSLCCQNRVSKGTNHHYGLQVMPVALFIAPLLLC